MIDLLRPTYTAEKVEDIQRRNDVLRGVNHVAFDVDGTLTEHHGTPDQSVQNMLRVLAYKGLSLSIISNAYGERVEQLHELFDPFGVEIFTPASVAKDDDRVTRFRKPNPAMLEAAGRFAGVAMHRTLMVGDQIAKDVVSANRARAKSLLVPRRGDADDIKVRMFQRGPENLVRAALGIRFFGNQKQ